MCTICVWADNGQACLSSRNMDWLEEMPSNVWVLPAGVERRAGPEGQDNVVSWTSKYGSIATENYGIGTSDGLNEKGLAASVLWLADTDYGDRDESLPALGLSAWAQYYLDNFEFVQDAVRDFEEHPYQLVPIDVLGRLATVHLHLSDATGDCAVFEVLDGQISIHHSPQFKVMTNSPPFGEQLENLRQYAPFGGDKRLPGTTQAADRFVRAAFYLEALKAPTSQREAIAGLLSVLRNVAQPYGEPDPERPNVSPTRWRTLRDQTNIRYFFESTSNPFPVWLDGKNLDFSKGAPTKVLRVDNLGESVGEMSSRLEEAEPFTFVFGEPVSAA